MQKGPEKPSRPAEHRVPAAIQDLLDKQNGPEQRNRSHDAKPSDLPGRNDRRLIDLDNDSRERFGKLPPEIRREDTVETVGDRLKEPNEIPAEATDRSKSHKRRMLSEIVRQADNVDQLSRDGADALETFKRRQYTHLPTRPPTGNEVSESTVARARPDRPPNLADTSASIAIGTVLTVQAIQATFNRIQRKRERSIDD